MKKIFYGTVAMLYRFLYKAAGIKRRIDSLYYFAQLRQSHVVFNEHSLKIFGTCKLRISPISHVELGDEVVIRGGTNATIDCGSGSRIDVAEGASLRIGYRSGISNTIIHCHEKIEIGDYVNIGAGCMIMDTNFHSTDWIIRRDRAKDVGVAKTKPVVIGNDVFIGAKSIICKGVTIGNKSMVAAGSVVVSNIGIGELWGGNPAVFLKKLKI